MELRVKRAPHIDTEITVPGDKSISHRAAIIAALSNGVCRLDGFLIGDDCMRTVNALRALGVRIDEGEPNAIIVHGKKRVLNPPAAEIECGNSATTMRLMAGLLAGQTFESRLVGDASLSKRPMDRVIAPLQRMGANITAEGPEETPPLRIHGGSLRGIRYQMPVPSAQVKSAILLAGLFAKGKTAIVEETRTRDHTERMLRYFFVRTTRDENGTIAIFGDQLPVLAVAGALANGTTIIRQAQELRVRETDRIAAIAHNLRVMGAQVLELSDGLEIHGPAPLRGGRVASFGDHRIAMAFAVAGLFADGETIVEDAECVEISYPGFKDALEQFMTTKRGPGSTPVIGSRSLAPVDQ